MASSAMNRRRPSSSSAKSARLARDEVESIFQRLASASLGHPGALAGLAPGRDTAAALVILRECMHHFGYDSVRRFKG